MNKERLKEYQMYPERVRELTGVDAELYVFTFDQLQELISENSKVTTCKIREKDCMACTPKVLCNYAGECMQKKSENKPELIPN